MDTVKLGNPDGSLELARSAHWYEAVYQAAHIAERLGDTQPLPPWKERQETQLIHLPAVRLCRGRVLDLGCGRGPMIRACAQAGLGYVLGSDPSITALRIAASEGVAPSLVLAEAHETLEYIADPSTYDTVLLLEVLEHVFRDLHILLAIPRGKLVVFSVPNFHTEGHCRWFGHVGQVIERYGSADLLEIDAVVETSYKSHRWWVVRGVRR